MRKYSIAPRSPEPPEGFTVVVIEHDGAEEVIPTRYATREDAELAISQLQAADLEEAA